LGRHQRGRCPGLSWVLANVAGLLQNLSLAAVSRLFTYGLVCAALPALRRKERRHADGIAPALFRVPGGAVLAAIGMAGSILLVSRMSAREALTIAAVLALATVHYIVGRKPARSHTGSDPSRSL
jgi:basic amino acid/polyamine antiporter, APA family